MPRRISSGGCVRGESARQRAAGLVLVRLIRATPTLLHGSAEAGFELQAERRVALSGRAMNPELESEADQFRPSTVEKEETHVLIEVVMPREVFAAGGPLALEGCRGETLRSEGEAPEGNCGRRTLFVGVNRADVPLEVLTPLETLAALRDLAEENLLRLARLGDATVANLRLARVRVRVARQDKVGRARGSTTPRALRRHASKFVVRR